MSAIHLLIALLAAGLIETSEACKQKMDLCFLLDSSATVCGGNDPCDNWKYALQFTKNITNTLDIGKNLDRVAIMTFSKAADLRWTLPNGRVFCRYASKDALLSAISEVPFKGGVFTDLASSIILGTEIFNPGSGDNLFMKNVILLITDGIPGVSDLTAEATSLAVQVYGVTVFVVGISPGCTKSWVKAVASKKTGIQTYFLVDSYSSLYTVLDTVLGQICLFIDGSSDSKPIGNFNFNLGGFLF